ncbi:hypothetical protein [Kineococcus glutinatus]|uniref:HD domain-containing protein n=1 Tax=Kineococcus glutinatus TaxID=1070872 RepID=A0ABP8VBH9_9ACTN
MLFAACVLHDLGLTAAGIGTRSEVDGAVAAAIHAAPPRLGFAPRDGGCAEAGARP